MVGRDDPDRFTPGDLGASALRFKTGSLSLLWLVGAAEASVLYLLDCLIKIVRLK